MCIDSSYAYLGKGRSLIWSKNIHWSLDLGGGASQYLDVESTFRMAFPICE